MIVVTKEPTTWEKLNEGLGGAHERIAYSNNIIRIAKARGCKTILEYDASYIAGIPGFNSCRLAQAGFDVTVAVNERDYKDAIHAWELTGLLKSNVHIIKDDGTLRLPSKSYDFVWNHLAFEHYPQPEVLLSEMERLSSDVVMNLTLAPYNFGFISHWMNHKIQHKHWDHGIIPQTTIGAMKKAHKENRLNFLESGACDVPPWLDTVDAQIKGTMTYWDSWPKIFRENLGTWCSADPECDKKSLERLFWHWEQVLPGWFKILVGHHLYVASTVKL